MRKLISLILAVLMVSMMIPAMALAEDSATPVDYAGLVAGETFTVTANATTSATITVNTQLFSINGAASATVDAVDGVASVEVTVNDSVPAVVEASRIKIEADGVVSYQVAAIADIFVGDANADGSITDKDAVQALRKSLSLSVDASFSEKAADATGDGLVTDKDAVQILRKSLSLSVENAGIGVDYIGGNAAIEIVDPFEGTTPDVPAEPTALATPANIYAYAQNGKIYYTFDAVEGAEGYSIAVSTLADAIVVTDATGSFDCAYTDGLTITVTATTTAEGFVNSAASAAVEVIEADASGALAEWLEANGLEDVAITVHEIK